jgi:hypothetical protein
MRAATKQAWTGGLYAGLLGYLVVVVFLALVNLLAGRSPFYTAALFGSALFYGLRDPAALVITPGAVLTYNMVHALAFLVLGQVVSWLVTEAERHPVLRYVVLVALIFVAVHVYGFLLLFAHPLLAGAAWWQLGAASVLAAAAMGGYLLWAHPALRKSLAEMPIGDEAEEPAAIVQVR